MALQTGFSHTGQLLASKIVWPATKIGPDQNFRDSPLYLIHKISLAGNSKMHSQKLHPCGFDSSFFHFSLKQRILYSHCFSNFDIFPQSFLAKFENRITPFLMYI